jgi:hypothetical protein
MPGCRGDARARRERGSGPARPRAPVSRRGTPRQLPDGDGRRVACDGLRCRSRGGGSRERSTRLADSARPRAGGTGGGSPRRGCSADPGARLGRNRSASSPLGGGRCRARGSRSGGSAPPRSAPARSGPPDPHALGPGARVDGSGWLPGGGCRGAHPVLLGPSRQSRRSLRRPTPKRRPSGAVALVATGLRPEGTPRWFFRCDFSILDQFPPCQGN